MALKTLKEKIVENGLFKLQPHDNGHVDIYRLHHLKGVQSYKQIESKRVNGHSIVYGTVDGKQQVYQTARLLAKAFVKVPPKLKQISEDALVVTYADGDKTNLNLNNLVWAERSSISKQILDDVHSKRATQCRRCGDTMHRFKTDICFDCERELNAERTEDAQRQKYVEEAQQWDMDLLTKRQREVAKLRLKGRTINEVCESLDISRRRVFQVLSDIRNRHDEVAGKREDEVIR